MKTLKCKDMDPSSTCDYKATGNDNAEVMANMASHAKEAHADKVSGMTDEQMNEMMMPHIKDEESVM